MTETKLENRVFSAMLQELNKLNSEATALLKRAGNVEDRFFYPRPTAPANPKTDTPNTVHPITEELGKSISDLSEKLALLRETIARLEEL